MQPSASARPAVVDARLRGHDVVGKAPGLRFILLAVAVVADLLGSPGAVAQERSDAMLRAFQDACFPRLDDLAARRQKVVNAGFEQVPVDAIPELRIAAKGMDLAIKLLGPPDSAQVLPVLEGYRGQREGFELVAVLFVKVLSGVRNNECAIYDFRATEPVSEKKVAAWIGRPADYGSRWSSRWTSGVAALPGGYDDILSTLVPKRSSPLAGALLMATARSPLQKTPK